MLSESQDRKRGLMISTPPTLTLCLVHPIDDFYNGGRNSVSSVINIPFSMSSWVSHVP